MLHLRTDTGALHSSIVLKPIKLSSRRFYVFFQVLQSSHPIGTSVAPKLYIGHIFALRVFCDLFLRRPSDCHIDVSRK